MVAAPYSRPHHHSDIDDDDGDGDQQAPRFSLSFASQTERLTTSCDALYDAEARETDAFPTADT